MKRKVILGFVLLLLSIIPMLYSGLFLGASMNPYGNLDKLPVALVKTKENIVEKELIKRKLFDFKEVENIHEAYKELKSGKVYAVISFDEDMQKKIVHFPKTKEPATLTLTVSEGLNYFSSKVVTSTMNQFVTKVDTALANNVIDKMQGMNIPESVSSIVQLKVKNIHPVKNNGEAMAPYLFSLTLFVGAIFVNQFVMRNLKKRGEALSIYWAKQFIFPLCIGIGQVILLLVGNQFFIHIPVHSVFQLAAFLFLTCAAFTSIIVGFNKLIPGIGSLIVLLLTMLQTSSAGGVYPIILTNGFFQKISACIPMTYSIKGLKSIISLDSIHLSNNVYILIGFFIFGQMLILFSYLIHEKPLRKI